MPKCCDSIGNTIRQWPAREVTDSLQRPAGYSDVNLQRHENKISHCSLKGADELKNTVGGGAVALGIVGFS